GGGSGWGGAGHRRGAQGGRQQDEGGEEDGRGRRGFHGVPVTTHPTPVGRARQRRAGHRARPECSRFLGQAPTGGVMLRYSEAPLVLLAAGAGGSERPRPGTGGPSEYLIRTPRECVR